MSWNYRYSSLIIGFILFCDFLGCIQCDNETIPLKIQDGWYKDKTPEMLGFFFSEGKFLACDNSAKSKNWLRTHYIPFNGAKRVFISINYTMRKCRKDSKYCKETFELYSAQTSKAASSPKPGNGFAQVAVAKPTNIKEGVPDEKNVTALNATIEAGMAGFYLAFFDQGACITLYSIQIIYYYCPKQANYLELVKFPKTISPSEDSAGQEVKGVCSDSNAENTTSLLAVCSSKGLWKIDKGIKCLCKPGYGYEEQPNKHCTACGAGQYKSIHENSQCKQCPRGSYTSAQRTSCTCSTGLFRMKKENSSEPCNALPSGPKLINTTTLNSSTILLTWPVPADKATTFTIKCFICKNGNDTKCVESCDSKKTVFSPGNSGLRGRVSVSKLKSGTKFRFKVYGVTALNRKVDPSEWKYANTYGMTKAASGAPQELTVLKSATDTVRLEWKAPQPLLYPVKKYTVSYYGKKEYECICDGFSPNGKKETLSTIIAITGLHPATSYTFTVTATTKCGHGKESNAVTVKTKTGAAPAPEVNQTVAISGTVVNLTLWSTSPINGVIRGYQVIVNKVNSGKRKKRSIDDENLTDYDKAKKDGLSYYIAAEIIFKDPVSVKKKMYFILGDGKQYGKYKNAKLETRVEYEVYQRALTKNSEVFVYGKKELIAQGKLPESNVNSPSKSCDSSYGAAIVIVLAFFLSVSLLVNIMFVVYMVWTRNKTNPEQEITSVEMKPPISHSASTRPCIGLTRDENRRSPTISAVPNTPADYEIPGNPNPDKRETNQAHYQELNPATLQYDPTAQYEPLRINYVNSTDNDTYESLRHRPTEYESLQTLSNLNNT